MNRFVRTKIRQSIFNKIHFTMSKNIGKIAQIIGPVVDVKFDNTSGSLPNIYDALEITKKNGNKIILECQQHIGEDTVRAI